jgi:hypothetical protein
MGSLQNPSDFLGIREIRQKALTVKHLKEIALRASGKAVYTSWASSR